MFYTVACVATKISNFSESRSFVSRFFYLLTKLTKKGERHEIILVLLWFFFGSFSNTNKNRPFHREKSNTARNRKQDYEKEEMDRNIIIIIIYSLFSRTNGGLYYI